MAPDTPAVAPSKARHAPCPAVIDLLQHTITIYRFLVGVHSDGQDDDSGLVRTARLDTLLSKLRSVHAAVEPHAEETGTLPWACCKVALDLCLKLDRIRTRFDALDGIQQAEFRAAWPVVDIEALGDRLSDLVGLCPDQLAPFK